MLEELHSMVTVYGYDGVCFQAAGGEVIKDELQFFVKGLCAAIVEIDDLVDIEMGLAAALAAYDFQWIVQPAQDEF